MLQLTSIMFVLMASPTVLYTDLPNKVTEPTRVSVGKMVDGFVYTPTNPFLDDGKYWAVVIKGKVKFQPWVEGSRSVQEVVKLVESGQRVKVTVGDGTLIGELVGSRVGVYPPGQYEVYLDEKKIVQIIDTPKAVPSYSLTPGVGNCPNGQCPIR
jgi:hypothetical protein